MDFWRNNTIWFDEVPRHLFRHIDLKEEKIKEITEHDLEYLVLWYHGQSKAGHFAGLPENLHYLEFNWSNMNNFLGIQRLNRLKRLELHYCTKLQSDSGLSSLSDTLEYLHINQSKKFVPTKELLSLKKLRGLRLNACGDLESLSFLHEFPHLISFTFVNTNVIDGDLTPILNHPSIREVGFLNKRHYNISDTIMDTLLEEKNAGVKYKTTVYKKENKDYSTFRYNDEELG